MPRLVFVILLLTVCSLAWGQVEKNQIMWDDGKLPPDWPNENPYSIYSLMICWKNPILDHTGKPHDHGHVIQLIMDGGNGIQDPPLPDGMPGGDDTLAFGNYNHIRLMGQDGLDDPNGKSGQFFAKRAFAPLVPNRTYYLRVWEGDDFKTAPYYQDTIEYVGLDDRGGAMFTPTPGQPQEIDWTFGPSKPRPGGSKS